MIDLYLGIWTNKLPVNRIFVCSFILRVAFWLKVWQPVATYFCFPGLCSSRPRCPWCLTLLFDNQTILGFSYKSMICLPPQILQVHSTAPPSIFLRAQPCLCMTWKSQVLLHNLVCISLVLIISALYNFFWDTTWNFQTVLIGKCDPLITL